MDWIKRRTKNRRQKTEGRGQMKDEVYPPEAGTTDYVGRGMRDEGRGKTEDGASHAL